MLDKKYYFTPKPLVNPCARIICFPYAGGSSGIYYDWPEHFQAHNIEVIAINLPGRGARFGSPFDSSIEQAVTNIIQESSTAFERPFYIYGHSNGGLYAYEMARQLAMTNRLHNCKHLFIGAKAAPKKALCREPLHRLNDDDFCLALRELGGTPEALLADQQLLELLLPMLRSDFKHGFDYMSAEPTSVLASQPCTLFYGTQDEDIGPSEVSPWQQLLPKADLQAIQGGHFFVHQQQQVLIYSLLTRITPP